MLAMETGFRISRNFFGLVIKLSILPCMLFSVSERLPFQALEVLSYGLGALLIMFGLWGMMISDFLILRFGNGNLNFSTNISRLVDVGFYARTRHPFAWFYSSYQLGILLIFLGFHWITLILFIGITLFLIFWLGVVQEPFLQRSLGSAYSTYKRSTPLFYWKLKIPENLSFGFRQQFVWVIGMVFIRFWYRIRVEGTENIPHNRPFLIVANHESYLDPFLFAIFIPFEIKFVTTADVFTTPLMRFLLKETGSFPMRRHKQDLKSIRTMIRMVNKGQVVCIFPEGGRSIDGSPLPILKETLKLIQRCKVPILPVHIDGAYEIWPRWAPNRRRGKVRTSFKPVIPIESQSDLNDLEQQITDSIFAEEKIFCSVKSRSITRGMDHLLWACCNCHTRNSIEVTSGQSLRCNSCRTEWQVADDYTFSSSGSPIAITSIEWIKRIQADILTYPLNIDLPFIPKPGEIIHLHSPVVRYSTEGNVDDGNDYTLTLSNQRMILASPEEEILNWPLETITIFTMDYFNAVSIGVGGVRHTFKLPPQEITLKWQTYFDALKVAL
jgi:1-acyl-sn-glycerol-3-phosphate acyltransferase